MYKVHPFVENNEALILSIADEIGIAFVGASIGTNIAGTHLPLSIKKQADQIIFSGHLMKQTDHHKAFENTPEVLVVYSSPSAVIDANWYASPSQASTINYIAIHAKGTIHFKDEAGTYEAIKAITNQHINSNSNAGFEQIPTSYLQQHVKAIVAFEIEVKQIDAVFKLSQNKTLAEQQNIIQQLKLRNHLGDAYIAQKMETLIQ
ncbi:FMN-binding negative transcriptional regulator [Ferruginibacter yonginensis]|uniref:FMN-binding negative transcriptional regulator n=1 Tax=Ferruginibacter yonginensis TaxID=1310416 RepID=A0ABV8QR35_9BACT